MDSTQLNDQLTIKDYFAAKMLQAIATHTAFSNEEAEKIAAICYEMADVMLKVRKTYVKD